VLDNDRGGAAATDDDVQACMAAADAVVRLPPRMAVEELLLDGVPDSELVRAFTELEQAFGDLALPANWDRLPSTDLRRLLARTLHNRPGSLHASYVWELDEAELPGGAISALDRIREVADGRQSGLVEL